MQSNYYVSGFLNINNNLNKSLWVSGKPTDFKEENGSILIAVPFYKQIINVDDVSREDNIDPKLYWLNISAYGSQVLRVSLETHNRSTIKNNVALLQFSKGLEKTKLLLGKKEEKWIIKDNNNKVRAVINFKKPNIKFWSDLIEPPYENLDITFFPDGTEKQVKLSSDDQFFPKRKGSLALALVEENGEISAQTIAFYAKSNENFCGTGERFTKLDLSGKTFNLQNQDGQGVNSRRTYKNVPFYISSEMYGVFLNSHAHCKFSFADISSKAVQILNEDNLLDTFIIGGESIEKIQYNYRRITGFPTSTPLWSYGIWMSKMTYESAEEINSIVEKLKNENYPFDVIHIDTGWFRKDWLCEWKFNDEKFPNPKEFIAKLKEQGVRISLWQMPYIAKEAMQCQEAIDNKYIGRPKEASNQSNSNFGVLDYEGTIDFTNPAAVEWYKNMLRELLEMGVACIKTDFGEEIHMDADYYGMDAKLLHNLYPLLYQKAAAEVTEEITGDNIVWARAGWSGCQRYPLHWGGDSSVSWDGLAGSLKGALHLGLSGFAYWSSDIPGFHGVPDFMNSILPNDLYVRWTQFSVFGSHMRYHGTSDREPYHFPKVAKIVRKWWKIRYALIPYIKKFGEETTNSGNPIIKALIFEHPNDNTCWNIDDQYYFGSDILVAPIMNSEGVRDIYLPEGVWVNFYTGKQTTGGKWIFKHEVPLDEIPVWIKKDAIIPIYPFDVKNTDDMDLSKVVNIKIDYSFRGIKYIFRSENYK